VLKSSVHVLGYWKILEIKIKAKEEYYARVFFLTLMLKADCRKMPYALGYLRVFKFGA
jgi:hypothetical protein